jgi:hypothetical protein
MATYRGRMRSLRLMHQALFSFALLLCFIKSAIAQNDTPYLERPITVSFTNERLDQALKKIADQGGFSFSYNSNVVEAEKLITQVFVNKTVRQILDEIFKGTIEYKIRSHHVILTKAKISSEEKDEQILSGYVVDEATGQRLKNVSVYDPVTLTSAVTDSYGFFEIKLDKPATDVKLSVNKESYSDTTFTVRRSNRLLNIPIKVDKKKLLVAADSVGEKVKRFWKTKILNPPNPNLRNIQEDFTRDFQFSLVPFVGTNHKLSGNVVNDYSLNLVGGYAKGVKRGELGGVFNIVRDDVTGVQVAGVFNTVGGKFTGVQFAGAANVNYDTTAAIQFAGGANVNWNSVSRASIAGLLNFTRRTSKGFHLAGISNFTIGKQKGAHVAGIMNFSTSDAGKLQLASVLNFSAGNVSGLQFAGIMNFAAKDVRGSQIAGILNFAGKRVAGSQTAGILNFATRVNGGQLALVNVADTVRGIPIGLFSFVMKGYHKIEFSADEIFHTNVAFRTGVRKFYNIFTVGAKPNTFKNDSTFWTFGYGIGKAPKIVKWLSLNLDLTSNQIVHQKTITSLQLLNKFYTGFDVHLTKHVSIAFGVTLNGYVTENGSENASGLFEEYNPKIIHERNVGSDHNLKMWWGGKAGIRFL